jgi:hypothetical protein
MVERADVITGRDALHRLDQLISQARSDFSTAVGAADAHSGRRAELAKLRAEGYRELAKMRLDVLKAGADASLSAAEAEATRLLEQHKAFAATIDGDVAKAAAELERVETLRREAEDAADVAVAAYEAQVAATEERLEGEPAYTALLDAFEDSKSVHARATQKLELAKTDRKDKGAPYESDPLFAYLWERKFRTTDYRGRGLIRSLDNWVAKVCGYDQAYLNYARLTELPDRLSEHVGKMKLEEAEAEAAIERYEAAALEADGAKTLSDAVAAAKERVRRVDAELSGVEKQHADLRQKQEQAATGDSGPQDAARRVIEASLTQASFPDLRVLAAETTTPDDDRVVDALVRLRTEELSMEVNGRSVDALPARRRASSDALETARRRFKEAGLDGPYVTIGAAAFEAAIDAYGRGTSPDGEKLFRAMTATVRQAPQADDSYFGGRRRRDSIGPPDRGGGDSLGGVIGGIGGVILDEIIREAARGGMRGRWGGGGWSGGGWGGGPSGGSWGGGSRGSRGSGGSSRPSGGARRGGGFKTGGRF